MAATILILVLVARGEAGDAVTRGVAQAASDVLGPRVIVEVDERERFPSQDGTPAEASADNAPPAMTVELTWDAAHRRARLHAHLLDERRWTERVFDFASRDGVSERGRTIGFAVAAMLHARPPSSMEASQGDSRASEPKQAEPKQAEPKQAEPKQADAQQADAQQADLKQEVNALETVRVESSTSSVSVDAPAAQGVSSRASRFVDVSAVAGSGVLGEGGGFGGAAGIRWYPSRHVMLRVGGALRVGEVDAAQASTLLANLGASVGWVFLSSDKAHPLELSVRTGALVLRDQVSHYSNDDLMPVRKSRFLPGMDAFVEGAWGWGATTRLLAGLGAEVAFGETVINVRHGEVARIAPLRVVGELGFSASF